MTAALAALGLIPAAISRAIGAETQRPIAIVIVGGTLSAALLTLIVLPVMYRLLLRALSARGGLPRRPPTPKPPSRAARPASPPSRTRPCEPGRGHTIATPTWSACA